MWSRRDLLRAAGAGAAAAVVGGFGCGRRAPAATTTPGGGLEGSEQGLQDALAILATRLRDPVVYTLERRRIRALSDLGRREVTDDTTLAVVVAGRDAQGRWRERGLDRATPALVRAAAQAVVDDAPAAAPTPLAGGAGLDFATPLEVDPDQLDDRHWLELTADIEARAVRTTTSRIVYRAAYVACDDDRIRVLTAGGERRQRLVRGRIGATAVSWQGNAPIAGAVEVAGGFGPDAARLSDDAIARSIADALAIHTPGAIAARDAVDVVLAPAVIAAIVDAGWAALPAGAAAVVTDDPTLPGGFGSFFFDDLGAVPAPVAIAGAASLAVARARRDPRRFVLAAAPSNLVMTPGAIAAAALEADLADGLVIEGVADLRRNPRGELAIRVTRARAIVKGRRTGHVWRDVELRGPAGALLGAIRAVGDRAETIAPVDDDRPPRAIVAPWVATRAAIGPARGGA